MSDANLIVKTDLTKPADTFVKKVSKAIGHFYEPLHVVKMAKANADAKKIGKNLRGRESIIQTLLWTKRKSVGQSRRFPKKKG